MCAARESLPEIGWDAIVGAALASALLKGRVWPFDGLFSGMSCVDLIQIGIGLYNFMMYCREDHSLNLDHQMMRYMVGFRDPFVIKVQVHISQIRKK